FGKRKALMHGVDRSERHVCKIFVTDMHTLKAYGNTQIEVQKEGFENLFVFHNQHRGEPMETRWPSRSKACRNQGKRRMSSVAG
ncbi:MAG TPA: hypothetical protein VD788_15885, partial [Candidatus Polarisedimenticolaceae bacterium]|nr:hypothetical protein [Candidatus Polarisedimenticolaceae bacterium]